MNGDQIREYIRSAAQAIGGPTTIYLNRLALEEEELARWVKLAKEEGIGILYAPIDLSKASLCTDGDSVPFDLDSIPD